MSSMQCNTRSSRGSSIVIENFKTFTASKGDSHPGRLEQQRRWKGIRDPKPDIATALSPSGWLATSSSTEVRLFRLKGEDVDTHSDIKKVKSISFKSEGEIRAIALSRDLLAIITQSHLHVFEYREPGSNGDIRIERRQIDLDQTWVPQSVAIRQRGSVGRDLEASAWVVVGGEGTHGVKLFKYSYKSCCWSAQSDRLILTCPQNTSSVGLVSFSPEPAYPSDPIIVSAVTISSRVYCWLLNQHDNELSVIGPSWRSNLKWGSNALPNRGEITSVGVFMSPSKKPYIFCAINQRQGSQLKRTCIAPLETPQTSQPKEIDQWRSFPQEAAGRNVLLGTATANGHFIVTIEDGRIKLLTLHGAYDGGLTCHARSLEWQTPLKPAAADTSGISMLVEESVGKLAIFAADARGHLMFADVSVPSMPPPGRLYIRTRQRSELPPDAVIRELSSGESADYSRRSGSSVTREHDDDRIEVVPG